MFKLLTAVTAAAAPVLAAAPAVSQSPVSLPTLAPTEVLVEVEAVGSSMDEADFACVTIMLIGSGATGAEATAALEAKVRQVSETARAAGVAPSDIETRSQTLSPAVLDDPMIMEAMAQVDGQPNNGSDARMAWRTLLVTIRDPSRAATIARALEDAGADTVAPPRYQLADDSAAIRTAYADGLRRARTEADALAAASGMRVVRMIRMTDRSRVDGPFGWMVEGPLARPPSGVGTRVATQVRLAVDYVLAPR